MILEEKYKFTKEHRKHLSESHKGQIRTEEANKKASNTMKRKWVDLEFKAKMIKALKGHFVSEETKKKIRKTNIKISLEQEDKIIKLYQNGLSTTEAANKLNVSYETVYGCLERNNIKKRKGGVRKGNIPWNEGLKFTEKQKKKLNMEGLKIGRGLFKGKTGIYSEARLKQMSEFMKTRVGKKAANWQGGLSFEPYGIEFNNQLKSQIRARDGNRCQMPRCGIYENGRCHSAHHIDYNKKNNSEANLITLCNRCHMKTNGCRKYWKKLFQNIQIQRGVN